MRGPFRLQAVELQNVEMGGVLHVIETTTMFLRQMVLLASQSSSPSFPKMQMAAADM